MTYTDLTAYIEAKNNYNCSSYSITSEGIFFHVKGELVPEKIWHEHNKVPIYIKENVRKGQNPDTRNKWMTL